jgi:hypothetical protein
MLSHPAAIYGLSHSIPDVPKVTITNNIRNIRSSDCLLRLRWRFVVFHVHMYEHQSGFVFNGLRTFETPCTVELLSHRNSILYAFFQMFRYILIFGLCGVHF